MVKKKGISHLETKSKPSIINTPSLAAPFWMTSDNLKTEITPITPSNVIDLKKKRGIFYTQKLSFFSSPPQRPMTSDFERFLYQSLSITLFSYLNSWERASIFPFECPVLNEGTTGTIFITSLVWRGPWLGIEPGTSALEASTIPLGYWGGCFYYRSCSISINTW